MSKKIRIPNHIAIIPDGNRRWALSQGLKKSQGYEHGLDPGVALYEQCVSLGIKEITFYGFTNDNTKRPAEETAAFRQACVDAVAKMHDKDAAILVVGNSESPQFPEELKSYLVRQPAGKNLIKVNFLVNYDWHWDLSKNVHAQGGRRRLSGMLPLQTVYSDFFVLDKYWPDLEPSDLEEALEWYSSQDITLGG